MRGYLWTTVASLLASAALAQSPPPSAGPPIPPPIAGPNAPSPELQPDGRVTFRLAAPDAAKVELRGSFRGGFPSPTPMSKAADGEWSATLGPLSPGFFFYEFSVDGARALDPKNPHTRRDGMNVASVLMVPGAQSDLFAVKNVPHGTVSQIWYPSPSLKLTRRTDIYTPPGYETGRSRYPVLYLLHGGGGDEDAWLSNGRLAQILDNLIASGRIRPMIVVMPNGNATQSASADYMTVTEPTGSFLDMAFADSLVTDLVPFIDRTYRTLADGDHRAISGLSMGGAHAVWAAFHHIDQFAWVDSMSGGYMIIPGAGVYTATSGLPMPPGYKLPTGIDADKLVGVLPDLTPAANAKLKLFVMTIGANDGLAPQQLALKAALDARGIKSEASVIPGYNHEWAFWRTSLIDLLPRLFKPTS
jgi:enterochelin esterase family protein